MAGNRENPTHHILSDLMVYLPMDRRQAIAAGTDLPSKSFGAGLFADISGFTPLTEALAKEYGPLRGAEELTSYLNMVYDGLIGVLHRFGGSVIGFSGDAITCWFEGDNGDRAVACGLEMQREMAKLSTIVINPDTSVSLAIKVAISTGTARRFVVGDPNIRYIDVISGKVLDNLATIEHMAEKGEVLLDEQTALSIRDHLEILEWRTDPVNGQKFGLVDSINIHVPETPWRKIPEGAIPREQLKIWVLNQVYLRLTAGQGDFLAELRPAVALFMRFLGIDFENDDQAEAKLNDFVTNVQRILRQYEGTLIQLTIGDKGSYLYAAFGAPLAHEDDAVRAASVALDLQALSKQLDYIESIQIGITRGRMRTGAYGGSQRKTYGVLGDAVNLSARLMQAAAAGEILVEQRVQDILASRFNFQSLPDVVVKGKTGSIKVHCLVCKKEPRSFQLHEPKHTVPMVGRETELLLASELLEKTRDGIGQILGIVAEAGMGKSRLAAEIIQAADQRNLLVTGGECVSFGTNTSYLVWQTIWRGLFQVPDTLTIEEQISQIATVMERIEPRLLPRLPLLGIVFNIPIPDNELTSSLDAKLRKSSLESLLLACLRAFIKERPTLIVLEDSHWMDPLSRDLLEFLARPSVSMPIMFMVVYRPAELSNLRAGRLRSLANFSEIELSEFSLEHAKELVRNRYYQIYEATSKIPDKLIEIITLRAQGNPFYIEELLNYFRHQAVDLQDPAAIEKTDLPASLHSLILSRIDQLEENRKTTLKIASVIGRTFRQDMLSGVHIKRGSNGHLEKYLHDLCENEFIDLDIEPDKQYIFKHIVTQEVSYNSLPFAQRAVLHERIGDYIEKLSGSNINTFVGLLAYHFGNSSNKAKKRDYLLLAAQAAVKDYANEAAIDYYNRLLPLLEYEEQAEVRMQLGKVYERTGKWEEAKREYNTVLNITEKISDENKIAWCQTAISELHRKRGEYDDAACWLDLAQRSFETQNNQAGLGQILHNGGTLAAQQGEFDRAIELYNKSLVIREGLNDKANIASLLSNLGIIAGYQNELQKSYDLYKESLDIRRQTEDKYAIAISLNNLGNAALKLGDVEEARKRLEEALGYQKQVGDQWGIANALNNLANCARTQEKYSEAIDLYHQSLMIYRDLGDKWALAYLLEDIGVLHSFLGEPLLTIKLIAAAAALRDQIGSPLPPVEQGKLDTLLNNLESLITSSQRKAAWEQGFNMQIEEAIGLALKNKAA